MLLGAKNVISTPTPADPFIILPTTLREGRDATLMYLLALREYAYQGHFQTY